MVDLRCVEQLIDSEQTAALAAILKHIVKKVRYLHGNAGAGCWKSARLLEKRRE